MRLRWNSTRVAIVLNLALCGSLWLTTYALYEDLVLHDLPYRDADRLIVAWNTQVRREHAVAGTVIAALRQQPAAISEVAGYTTANRIITFGDDSINVRASGVSANTWGLLGTAPMLGSGFDAADTRDGAEPAVILSHSAWTRWFGRDPQVTDRSLVLDGSTARIRGVMPRGFFFPSRDVDVWLPLSDAPFSRDGQRIVIRYANIIARPAVDSTTERVESELRLALTTVGRLSANEAQAVVPRSFVDHFRGRAASAASLMLGGALALLALGCCNAAVIMLIHLRRRQQVVKVLTVLGASPGRLAMAELRTGLAGGALGATVAVVLTQGWLLSARTLAADVSVPFLFELTLTTVAYGVLVSLAAGFLSALPAAITAFRMASAGVTRGHPAGNKKSSSLAILAAIELAVAIALTASAITIASRWRTAVAEQVDRRSRDVFTATVRLVRARYPQFESRVHAIGALAEAVRGPGGRVAIADTMPEAPARTSIQLPGLAGTQMVAVRAVTASYFTLLHVPFVTGSTFEEQSTQPNVIINQALAEALREAGRDISSVRLGDQEWRVSGVVAGTSRELRLAQPEIFVPISQFVELGQRLTTNALFEPVVLWENAPARLQTIAHQVVPWASLSSPATLQQHAMRTAYALTSMYVAFLCFSAIAIGVALAGLSAVWITQGMSQRRARSICLALGARPTALVRRAVTRDLLTVSAGTILGGLLAAALMAFGSRWSDEVGVVDWRAAAVACAVLACSAMIVSSCSAWHTSRRADMASLNQKE